MHGCRMNRYDPSMEEPSMERHNECSFKDDQPILSKPRSVIAHSKAKSLPNESTHFPIMSR